MLVTIMLGVKFNFKRISLRWLLWLVKAHNLLSMQHPSTTHLY